MLPDQDVLTVSALNRLIKNTLEKNLSLVCVEGEISNCVRASSGHIYFSLKDDLAQVRCILWRGIVGTLETIPQNGDQFLVYGNLTVYEARGDYQIQVKKIIPRGSGQLYILFEKLKNKLEKEGLFDVTRKSQLPRYPLSVGIATSLQAAALMDVMYVIRQTRPDIETIIYPIPVQGKGIGDVIAQTLRIIYERYEVDVLLVVRGGGSMEDLWAFNEEVVARAIFESPIPTISGIGHETDFTISDFVADARAPTPTAAAHLLGNTAQEKKNLLHIYQRMNQHVSSLWHQKQQHLDRAQMKLQHPITKLYKLRQQLQSLCHKMTGQVHNKLSVITKYYYHLSQRLDRSIPCCNMQRRTYEKLLHRLSLCLRVSFETTKNRVQKISQSLMHLNPKAVLERGYSMTMDNECRVISSFSEVSPPKKVKIILGSGHLEASVTLSCPPSDNDDNTK
ncbi:MULTISPECIES: exodeoxyribonuclease VII large subunit [Candidatus Ichthyocystis]|uniref:exodeoxyribonuclease VII large subunit n=1 Tax=Candidatus Ichthyocystis TaxID=2929841 RepID=UPI000AB6DF8B|nr:MULTISPECIES: exodeoxyribonuclease VII large subunit [Ichthyocystis]